MTTTHANPGEPVPDVFTGVSESEQRLSAGRSVDAGSPTTHQTHAKKGGRDISPAEAGPIIQQTSAAVGEFQGGGNGVAAEPPSRLSRDELFRVMERLSTVRSRIAENEATAQREHERIDAWLAEETKSDRGYAAMLEAQAQSFLREQIADDPSAPKSIRTPWGKVESRATPPEYERDDALLLAWAADNGYMRETADWERIKRECHVRGNRLVTAEGECVPGITVTERERKFTVTTA